MFIDCKWLDTRWQWSFNTLRTGAFKLFKWTFPGLNNLNQLLCCVPLKIYNKFANYFC